MRKPPKEVQLIIPTCYWWHDHETGEWIMIPGCGARANNPDHCTCRIPESRLERERGKRRAAEDTAARLRDALVGARHEANSMRLSNRHWWKVLRDHGITPSDHNPPAPHRHNGRWP